MARWRRTFPGCTEGRPCWTPRPREHAPASRLEAQPHPMAFWNALCARCAWATALGCCWVRAPLRPAVSLTRPPQSSCAGCSPAGRAPWSSSSWASLRTGARRRSRCLFLECHRPESVGKRRTASGGSGRPSQRSTRSARRPAPTPATATRARHPSATSAASSWPGRSPAWSRWHGACPEELRWQQGWRGRGRRRSWRCSRTSWPSACAASGPLPQTPPWRKFLRRQSGN
mmetsp:Transcript_10988/g.30877  ORF Transcript_10988/g.30877 Transcript_10988/m.30877 type:complete len:230 (-) Transcript_10988:149-838(-)